MPKRIWNRVFCSHKLNALCAVLLKSNFARASSYVLDNNLANYLEFLLYACPSSLSRMNTRLSFFGNSFTDHSCKHTCFLSGFKKYLNVVFFKNKDDTYLTNQAKDGVFFLSGACILILILIYNKGEKRNIDQFTIVESNKRSVWNILIIG